MDDAALDTFLEKVRPEARGTVIAVDEAVRAEAPVTSAIKWGKLTYAVEADFHHWICATSVGKDRVTLTFHFGGLLADPNHAFRSGSSTFLRMLDFPNTDGVDRGLIAETVASALRRLEFFKAHWKEISAGTLDLTSIPER